MNLQDKLELMTKLQIASAQIREGLYEIEEIMQELRDEISEEMNGDKASKDSRA